MMPYSWSFQKPWEDFFTVVQGDQRGCGKNVAGADLDALAKTMSIRRIVSDAEQVVAWLRDHLGVKKIFVIGYSWGSAVGIRLAARRP